MHRAVQQEIKVITTILAAAEEEKYKKSWLTRHRHQGHYDNLIELREKDRLIDRNFLVLDKAIYDVQQGWW